MVLTILGSGTAIPDGSRNSSGYFIESDSLRMMLDCGAGTVPALARYKVPWETMTHLFVSHFHVDHVGELASLMFAFKWGAKAGRTDPLTIVGPKGLDRLVTGLSTAYSSNLFEPGFPVIIEMLSPGERLRISEDCDLSVIKTPHSDESLAVRVDFGRCSFGYTGDTAYSGDLAESFGGADLLVSECSYPEVRASLRHLSIDQVAELAAMACVKRLVVSHFYFQVDHARLLSQIREIYFGEIFVACDGMRIQI